MKELGLFLNLTKLEAILPIGRKKFQLLTLTLHEKKKNLVKTVRYLNIPLDYAMRGVQHVK